MHRRAERLALFDRAHRDRHVDDVGAQALSRKLERRARAGGALEEQVDEGAAAKRRQLLVGAAVLLDVGFGDVEKKGDLVGGKPLDSQQVAVGESGITEERSH